MIEHILHFLGWAVPFLTMIAGAYFLVSYFLVSYFFFLDEDDINEEKDFW